MNTLLSIKHTILILIMTLNVQAQNYSDSSGCATNPPNFSQLSYEDANEAVNSEVHLIAGVKVKKICQEYAANLLNQLRHEQLSNDKKVLAIYLLGYLRLSDTNSIEYLIENIDFQALKLDPKLRFQRWSEYPARDALTRIGKPVVNLILHRLETEASEPRRRLIYSVLCSQQVLGRAAALDQLKERISAGSDSGSRANLELALKELEQ